MEGKVLLYDYNDVKIGETYVRRARQLVKQQRAFWTDGSQTAIRFLPGAENMESAAHEEDPAADKRLMKLARTRVILRTVFKVNCMGYLAVNTFLVAIWFFVAGRGYFWPGWVIAGWGLGLIIMGIVFKAVTSTGLSFNDKVADEYDRMRGN
ncbi:MAG: 2TM domain-containing protein [Defluviitaleaceae bacterium]|nr:2TM domain-containing protein [Defluviitaleaceae bacterium]